MRLPDKIQRMQYLTALCVVAVIGSLLLGFGRGWEWWASIAMLSAHLIEDWLEAIRDSRVTSPVETPAARPDSN